MPRDRSSLGSRLGLASHASEALAKLASRPQGLLVFCGPAGAGKTTLAQLLVASRPRPIVHWRGDLCMPSEIRSALATASAAPVIAVMRSGESRQLRNRWRDMEIEDAIVVPRRRGDRDDPEASSNHGAERRTIRRRWRRCCRIQQSQEFAGLGMSWIRQGKLGRRSYVR